MTAHLPPHERLAAWSEPGCSFLGCEVAILGGAMTWVSESNLVASISNAGGFGVLACGSMSPPLLLREIGRTMALTSRPFGVNLIVMHPELGELAGVCVRSGVTHVVLAGGLPPRHTMAVLKDGGVKVLCFAPSAPVAKKLVRQGADALIIEGNEAGGHIGPVSTSVLAQEILPQIAAVPVFVAGGIGHGEAIAAYLRMGASGVQIGTLFVCSAESIAHRDFKQAFIRASARDAMATTQIDPEFKVIPVRALANAGSRRFVEYQLEVIAKYRRHEISHEEASLAIEHFWAGALRRAVIEGDVENGSLMAGQSVGLVKSIKPTGEIIADLVAQAEDALQRNERSRPAAAFAG
jgi:enoyl-[acyl-carrier protein] reductase II